jgi:ATP-dependent Clp protease adaptor protein ClpS
MKRLFKTFVDQIMSASEKTDESTDTVADIENIAGDSAKVILFNDEWHTFEEVSAQIVKAIQCTMKIAEGLTWEVHTKGLAKVFSGDFSKCLIVSSVLEEIGLRTQIEY